MQPPNNPIQINPLNLEIHPLSHQVIPFDYQASLTSASFNQIAKHITVPQGTSELCKFTCYHGTAISEMRSVLKGPLNMGSGFGAEGLYIFLNEPANAAEYASIKTQFKGVPGIMEGSVNPNKSLVVGRIQVVRPGHKTDLLKGIWPADWAKNEGLKNFVQSNFDILEICGAEKAGLAMPSNRFAVFYQRSGPDAIRWHKVYQLKNKTVPIELFQRTLQAAKHPPIGGRYKAPPLPKTPMSAPKMIKYGFKALEVINLISCINKGINEEAQKLPENALVRLGDPYQIRGVIRGAVHFVSNYVFETIDPAASIDPKLARQATPLDPQTRRYHQQQLSKELNAGIKTTPYMDDMIDHGVLPKDLPPQSPSAQILELERARQWRTWENNFVENLCNKLNLIDNPRIAAQGLNQFLNYMGKIELPKDFFSWKPEQQKKWRDDLVSKAESFFTPANQTAWPAQPTAQNFVGALLDHGQKSVPTGPQTQTEYFDRAFANIRNNLDQIKNLMGSNPNIKGLNPLTNGLELALNSMSYPSLDLPPLDKNSWALTPPSASGDAQPPSQVSAPEIKQPSYSSSLHGTGYSQHIPPKPKNQVEWDKTKPYLTVSDNTIRAGVQTPIRIQNYPFYGHIEARIDQDTIKGIIDICKGQYARKKGQFETEVGTYSYDLHMQRHSLFNWFSHDSYKVTIKDPDGREHTRWLKVDYPAQLGQQLSQEVGELVGRRFQHLQGEFNKKFTETLATGDHANCQKMLSDFATKYPRFATEKVLNPYKTAVEESKEVADVNANLEKLKQGPLANVTARILVLSAKGKEGVLPSLGVQELNALKGIFLSKIQETNDVTVATTEYDKIAHVQELKTLEAYKYERREFPKAKFFKKHGKHWEKERRNEAEKGMNAILGAFDKVNDAINSGQGIKDAVDNFEKIYNEQKQAVFSHKMQHWPNGKSFDDWVKIHYPHIYYALSDPKNCPKEHQPFLTNLKGILANPNTLLITAKEFTEGKNTAILNNAIESYNAASKVFNESEENTPQKDEAFVNMVAAAKLIKTHGGSWLNDQKALQTQITTQIDIADTFGTYSGLCEAKKREETIRTHVNQLFSAVQTLHNPPHDISPDELEKVFQKGLQSAEILESLELNIDDFTAEKPEKTAEKEDAQGSKQKEQVELLNALSRDLKQLAKEYGCFAHYRECQAFAETCQLLQAKSTNRDEKHALLNNFDKADEKAKNLINQLQNKNLSQTQQTVLEHATFIREVYRTKEYEMALVPQYYAPLTRVAFHVLNDYATRLQNGKTLVQIAQVASTIQLLVPQTLAYLAAWPLANVIHKMGDKKIVGKLIIDTLNNELKGWVTLPHFSTSSKLGKNIGSAQKVAMIVNIVASSVGKMAQTTAYYLGKEESISTKTAIIAKDTSFTAGWVGHSLTSFKTLYKTHKYIHTGAFLKKFYKIGPGFSEIIPSIMRTWQFLATDFQLPSNSQALGYSDLLMKKMWVTYQSCSLTLPQEKSDWGYLDWTKYGLKQLTPRPGALPESKSSSYWFHMLPDSLSVAGAAACLAMNRTPVSGLLAASLWAASFGYAAYSGATLAWNWLTKKYDGDVIASIMTNYTYFKSREHLNEEYKAAAEASIKNLLPHLKGSFEVLPSDSSLLKQARLLYYTHELSKSAANKEWKNLLSLTKMKWVSETTGKFVKPNVNILEVMVALSLRYQAITHRFFEDPAYCVYKIEKVLQEIDRTAKTISKEDQESEIQSLFHIAKSNLLVAFAAHCLSGHPQFQDVAFTLKMFDQVPKTHRNYVHWHLLGSIAYGMAKHLYDVQKNTSSAGFQQLPILEISSMRLKLYSLMELAFKTILESLVAKEEETKLSEQEQALKSLADQVAAQMKSDLGNADRPFTTESENFYNALSSIFSLEGKIKRAGAASVGTLTDPFEGMGFDRIDFTVNLGNCFFDNIAAQLENKTSQALRQEMVQFMNAHTEKYGHLPDYVQNNTLLWGEGNLEQAYRYGSWSEYLHIMAQNLVWTGEIECHALAKLLKRPIVLMEVGKPTKRYNRKSQGVPLFIEHVRQNHFVARLPKAGVNLKEAYEKVMEY